MQVLWVPQFLHSSLGVILVTEIFELHRQEINLLHVVGNLLTVKDFEEALDLLNLIGQSCVARAWLPPTKHMVDEVDSLLQLVHFEKYAQVALRVIHDQFADLLRLLGLNCLGFLQDLL